MISVVLLFFFAAVWASYLMVQLPPALWAVARHQLVGKNPYKR